MTSGRDHSDDSSGNLAAGEPTVPDFTVDSSHPKTPDPNDTQDDNQVARRPKQDQNVTNDPAAATRRNDAADGDTMDDPLAARSLELPGQFGPDVTEEEPHVAAKKGRANVVDETLQEPHGQRREVNSDAPDTTADLLHELFQSAMSIASIGSKGADAAAKKKVDRNSVEKLFDGRFELLTELGAGGMGTVFKAHDRELDRVIAIKVLSLVGRDTDARIQRFLQEARAAAKLSHPNIIKIHDLHTADTGERYIQFEYVEGCSLSNLLAGFKQKSALMPLNTVLDCAIQSLAALECMHENNIVHRDVKPANIMLEKKTNARDLSKTPDDALQEGARTAKLDEYPDVEYRVKLVDFGLAKIRDEDDNTMMSITRKGQAVGTAAYMSPEQCGGERVDGCSDIYSLGCILFEMLTGRVPFRGADSAETMRLHQNAAIPLLSLERPTLPEADKFERIVNKMLAKERTDRYLKAEHVKDDLKDLYIGIKSGAIMEALQSEKGHNVPNPSNLPGELHPNIPKVSTPGGGLDDLQVVPESTVPDLYDPHKQQKDASSRGALQADSQNAERKIYADPLALDETAQESIGQRRQVYPDPLATDADQPTVPSQASVGEAKGASAGSINTNWDPIGGTPPVSSNSKQQSTPTQRRPGQGFSEGDLFARKYEVKGHIGQGGMGVVYKAVDLVLGRTVAIKFLKGKSGISQMEMSRFQQEAKAIASLNHTNIIRVHDMSVTDEGDPFFVLEYLEGHALSSEIRGKKQLPLERALSIISQVCDALQHAHDSGVIHRDIKPSNLMIVPQKDGTESVKLLDFGIAKLNPIDEETLLKLTKTGELFGSPHYMSPEQCSGKTIAEQSDIYSLGCVLYELICGVPPFSGQSAFDTLDKHKNASTPSVTLCRKDLPESKMIDALLDKMMAKDPTVRFQTAAEVKVAIQEIEKKLKGSSFQQFKKNAFPNGLSDARGKKNAALILGCVVVVSGLLGSPFMIFGAVNQKAPDMVPWYKHDLNGQLLFDRGAYRSAEKEFLSAVEKAKSETNDARNLHLYTSLQQLRILYAVLHDDKGLDRTSGELLECAPPEIERKKYSWDDAAVKLSNASTNSDFASVLEMARKLTIEGDSSSEVEKGSMLQRLVEVARTKSCPQSLSDQLYLLEAYWARKNSRPVSSKVLGAISRLLNGPTENLQPEMASQLAMVGLKQTGTNLQNLEKFAEYGVHNCRSKVDSLRAQLDLSEIYRLTGRNSGAVETMDQCLLQLEKLLPRKNWLLICALKGRADLYIQEHKFSSAIPLLSRALATYECITTPEKRSGVNQGDEIRSSLASAYAGTDNGSKKAEKILLALVENTNSPSAQRAGWLRQLGSLYLQSGQLDDADKVLTESVAVLSKLKSTDRYYSEQHKFALSELARVREKRSSRAPSKSPLTNSAVKAD